MRGFASDPAENTYGLHLCHHCGGDAMHDSAYCVDCADQHNNCVICGAPRIEGSDYCEPHNEDAYDRQFEECGFDNDFQESAMMAAEDAKRRAI